MSNAKAVTEVAIYQALAAAISGASVFQDVPDNFTGAAVVLGPMKSRPIGAPEDPDRDIELAIVAMLQAEERAPVLGLMTQIETALAGVVLRPAGWKLGVHFIDDDAQLDDDGVTYVGTSLFRILALTD